MKHRISPNRGPVGGGLCAAASIEATVHAVNVQHSNFTDRASPMEPFNEGRDKRDRITYDSLWVHAKRHYDLAGIAAYWRTRMYKEFKKALGGVRTPIE